MTTLLWVLIVGSAAWVGFAYVGYPLLLVLLARRANRTSPASGHRPPISVIIAVHNGEHEIADKLRNTLATPYPGDLEIIVASDHSTDGTDSIVREFDDDRVRLVRNTGARGKESAQAVGIAAARGEVLVFTDVSAKLSEDALAEIVAPFLDPAGGMP